VIDHLNYEMDVSNELSRRAEHEIGDKRPMPWLQPTLAAITISQSYGNLVLDIMAAPENIMVAKTTQPIMVDITVPAQSKLSFTHGVVTYKTILCLTAVLCNTVRSQSEDNLESAHFG